MGVLVAVLNRVVTVEEGQNLTFTLYKLLSAFSVENGTKVVKG